ncbi:MAG: hypothetical protein A3J83_07935 [Elusimicrobia bacterium RIFOXYA2_FULL_40_6]|nr:MAG: hypothetical protein A3J83_07935 [Elusimicrobia bacterium RIFOXYA2_FULL_40_6]
MIRKKNHIVLVGDANQISGIVTLEDILEELVGDIEDEYDSVPNYIYSYGTAWIMGGGVLMDKVASAVGLNWSEKYNQSTVPTLGEWCTEILGHPPKGGEIIEGDNLRVMPRKFRRKKLAEAVVSIAGDAHRRRTQV